MTGAGLGPTIFTDAAAIALLKEIEVKVLALRLKNMGQVNPKRAFALGLIGGICKDGLAPDKPKKVIP